MRQMIAFSGGCHSGKTTLMRAMADRLRDMGKDVLVFKENAHNYLEKGGIDELRANPSKYLDFQEVVVNERINFEKQWLNNQIAGDDQIVLVDRPISDSLAYIFMYINVDSLSDEDKRRYRDLVFSIRKHIVSFWRRTNKLTIFSLEPLVHACPDSETEYRPKSINSVKYAEYEVTKSLLRMYPESVEAFMLTHEGSIDQNIDEIIALL